VPPTLIAIQVIGSCSFCHHQSTPRWSDFRLIFGLAQHRSFPSHTWICNEYNSPMSQYRPWAPGIECKQGASVSGTVPLRFSWSQVGNVLSRFPFSHRAQLSCSPTARLCDKRFEPFLRQRGAQPEHSSLPPSGEPTDRNAGGR